MSGLFRINTNTSSQFAQRQLGDANSQLQEANQRLSSGKRINSAADDAAGLAITEKMTTQIRGIDMGTRNTQDAVSMVQTAEGALSESESMIQRMRELTIQSATETLTTEDRDQIQKEVNNLAIEMQRIADDTQFNERQLLDGTLQDSRIQVGANERQRIELDVSDMGTESSALDIAEYAETDEINVGSSKNIETRIVTSTGTNDINNNNIGNSSAKTYRITRENNDLVIQNSSGSTVAETITSTGFNEGVVFEGTTQDRGREFGDDKIVFEHQVTEGEFTISNGNITESSIPPQELQDGIAKNGLEAGEYTIESANNNRFELVDDNGEVAATTSSASTGVFKTIPSTDSTVLLDFSKSVVSDLGNGNMFSSGTDIDIGGPNISQNIEKATEAISQMDRALEELTGQRTDLGAAQNRLERTMSVNEIQSENLSAARSRIEDTDVAEESVKRTRANILLQATTGVLSQANSNPQLALQLLGGG